MAGTSAATSITQAVAAVAAHSPASSGAGSSSACVHCPKRGATCRFGFGTFFRKDAPASQVRASSYLTVWLGTRSKAYGYGFNPYWHGRMLERVRAVNGTAVYYSYVSDTHHPHPSSLSLLSPLSPSPSLSLPLLLSLSLSPPQP